MKNFQFREKKTATHNHGRFSEVVFFGSDVCNSNSDDAVNKKLLEHTIDET